MAGRAILGKLTVLAELGSSFAFKYPPVGVFVGRRNASGLGEVRQTY